MCDTAVRVVEGRVLFAKNSDRDANEAQVLEWVGAEDHAPGSRVRCTWVEIPQVEHTFAVLLSRPFWMWGAEIGANEHGVVIGNEAVWTRAPMSRAPGLLGMDLLRLGLERARDARGAVEVIAALLEAHGQGGGCGLEDPRFTYHNSFIVADAGGAFVLETAGRLWACEPVEGARSISNGLTIPGFAQEHRHRLIDRVARCDTRRARTQALSCAAAGPGDMMALLRDHGGPALESPDYSWLTGSLGAVCQHGKGQVAGSVTTASWVAELRAEGARHWVTGTSAPCVGLFKPVSVGSPVAMAGSPTELADPVSLWWRHERLHRAVMRDPGRLGALFVPERDALEAAWLSEPPTSAQAFAEGDARLSAWTERVVAEAGADRRPWHMRRYWSARDRMARR